MGAQNSLYRTRKTLARADTENGTNTQQQTNWKRPQTKQQKCSKSCLWSWVYTYIYIYIYIFFLYVCIYIYIRVCIYTYAICNLVMMLSDATMRIASNTNMHQQYPPISICCRDQAVYFLNETNIEIDKIPLEVFPLKSVDWVRVLGLWDHWNWCFGVPLEAAIRVVETTYWDNCTAYESSRLVAWLMLILAYLLLRAHWNIQFSHMDMIHSLVSI